MDMFSKKENYSLFDPRALREGAVQDDVITNESVTNIKFSIDKVKILKKKELASKAEIFLAWVVADDTSSEPIKMGNTNIFKNIKKGEELTIGPTGLTVYRNESGKLPKYIRYSLLVIESDKGIRDFGDALEIVRSSDEFKELTKSIIATTSLAAPQVALATAGVDLAMKLIAKTMSMNNDDQMILIEGSYEPLFDDLEKFKGVNQKSRYAEVHYSIKAV